MKHKFLMITATILCGLTLLACGFPFDKLGAIKDLTKNHVASTEAETDTDDEGLVPDQPLDEFTLADGSTCRDPEVVTRAKDEATNKILSDWEAAFFDSMSKGDTASARAMLSAAVPEDEETINQIYSYYYGETYVDINTYVYCFDDNVIYGVVQCGKDGMKYLDHTIHLVNEGGSWKYSSPDISPQVEEFDNTVLVDFTRNLLGDSYVDVPHAKYSIKPETVYGISDSKHDLYLTNRYNALLDDGSFVVCFRIINNSDQDVNNLKFEENVDMRLAGIPFATLSDFEIDPDVTIYSKGYLDLTLHIPEKAVVYPENTPAGFDKYAYVDGYDHVLFNSIGNSGHDGYHGEAVARYTAEAQARIDNISYPNNFLKNFDTTSMFDNGCYVFGNENYSCKKVTKVIFENTLEGIPEDAWDASRSEDGRVMVYVTDGSVVHIAGNGGVTGVNCFSLFAGYESLQEVDFNNSFFTEPCYSFKSMFYRDDQLTSVDLTQLNTSYSHIFDEMFFDCEKLTTIDVSHFNTSHAVSMDGMFYGCTGVTSLDVSNFDFSNVVSTREMFERCSNLTYLNIGNPDTSKITDARAMFASCPNLHSLDGSISFSEEADTKYLFNNSGLE